MTKINTVTNFIENIAPLELQEGYDNAGLITGSPDWEVHGVICALDCTPDVVQEAIQEECNLIVCHHPIVFSGLKKLSGDSYVERTVVKAIRHDIAIYAAHTNLDKVLHHGVSTRMAERLHLESVEILDPADEDGVTGLGVIGNLTEPASSGDFLRWVKSRFELEIIRFTENSVADKIRKVALCGGSGSFLLEKAKAAGADAFITADYKYHQFFDGEGRIMILDIGHFESEKYTIQLLYELISNNFSNFAAQTTKVNTNPVRYFK